MTLYVVGRLTNHSDLYAHKGPRPRSRSQYTRPLNEWRQKEPGVRILFSVRSLWDRGILSKVYLEGNEEHEMTIHVWQNLVPWLGQTEAGGKLRREWFHLTGQQIRCRSGWVIVSWAWLHSLSCFYVLVGNRLYTHLNYRSLFTLPSPSPHTVSPSPTLLAKRSPG